MELQKTKLNTMFHGTSENSVNFFFPDLTRLLGQTFGKRFEALIVSFYIAKSADNNC